MTTRKPAAPPRRQPKTASRKAPEGGRTFPQRTATTRARLLKAAADVFGRLGHADARVEDILAAAKISRPTFYRFFESKDEIFDALSEASLLALVHEITSLAAKATNPIQRLEFAIEGYLRWLSKTGPLALTIIEQSYRPGSRQAPRREATIGALTNWLEAEVAQYRSAEYDPVLFSALIGLVEHIGIRLLRESGRLGEQQIKRGKAIALRILYATLAESREPLPPIPRKPTPVPNP